MPSVIVRRHDAVLEILMNRPEVLNAADREMIGELAAASAEAAEDASARVVLLRGAGAHFCAGGDINMFGELIGLPAAERRKALYRIVDGLHPLLVRLRQMPKPVVAAVHGAAAGVGLSLVLAADLAIAADDAVFATGYIHLGTSPDGGLTATLTRVVGLKHAAELMMLGDRFDAPRAVQLGVVNRMVPPAALDAEAMALATRLANGPTHAYGRTKALLQATLGDTFDAQLRRETELRGLRCDRRICRRRPRVSRKTPPEFLGSKAVVTKTRRTRWIGLAVVASAGLLSACYYYPYGYYWWGYPYPQFYAWGYPYAAGYSYPPTPGAAPPDLQQPPPGTVQPLNAPVQRTPLPPAPPPQ